MKFDDFRRGALEGPRLRGYGQVRVCGCILAPSKQLLNTRLLTCKQLKADTRLVNLQLHTAGLEMTGKQ